MNLRFTCKKFFLSEGEQSDCLSGGNPRARNAISDTQFSCVYILILIYSAILISANNLFWLFNFHYQVMESQSMIYIVSEFASQGEIFGKHLKNSKWTWARKTSRVDGFDLEVLNCWCSHANVFFFLSIA